MKKLSRLYIGATALLCAGTVAAAGNLAISIGIRETEAGGGPTGVPIGGNGGSAGGIEFVDLDGRMLNLNGTFQTFEFDIANATLTPFAGATANGVLDGPRGVLEMIRIRNIDGNLGPIDLHIDDLRVISPTGAITLITGWEGFPNGTEVVFQEPGFSGSTAANLKPTPNVSAVTDALANNGLASYLVQFEFLDGTNTRWVRLTTFNTPNLPNPVIEFGQGWKLAFEMRGEIVPEPSGMALLLLGAPLLRRRR